MIVLDSQALIAYLTREPAFEEVEVILQGGQTAMSVVNLAEVIDHMLRIRQVPQPALAEILTPLTDQAIELRPADEAGAWRASELRATHYHRESADLSLADCILLATAKEDESIATSDSAVVTVARAEGIEVIALPDSDGSRP